MIDEMLESWNLITPNSSAFRLLNFHFCNELLNLLLYVLTAEQIKEMLENLLRENTKLPEDSFFFYPNIFWLKQYFLGVKKSENRPVCNSIISFKYVFWTFIIPLWTTFHLSIQFEGGIFWFVIFKISPIDFFQNVFNRVEL